MPGFANPPPIDQLPLVKSSDGLYLPHQEGACLSPSLPQKMNRREFFFRDDSASFVLQKRKTTRIFRLRNERS